jgi:hypothetical protein
MARHPWRARVFTKARYEDAPSLARRPRREAKKPCGAPKDFERQFFDDPAIKKLLGMAAE